MARLIAYFFLGILYAIGPLLFVVAIALSIPTIAFVQHSIATDATILDLQRVYLPRRSKSVYEPVFRFTADDGQTYTLRSGSNASFVPFKSGDRIRVRYLKDKPQTARIDSVAQLWTPQLILGVIGALFFAFSRIVRRRSASRGTTPVRV